MILINDKILAPVWDAVVNLMDDEIREKVHVEMAPCGMCDFLTCYCTYDPGFYDVICKEFFSGGNAHE